MRPKSLKQTFETRNLKAIYTKYIHYRIVVNNRFLNYFVLLDMLTPINESHAVLCIYTEEKMKTMIGE